MQRMLFMLGYLMFTLDYDSFPTNRVVSTGLVVMK